ncbi:SDR family oxidoreductase [Salinibacterium sp. ZJ77]|uniref:SDR family NAD(P)-dependent oxidoreductase n=1 Tax=Salinibacterium sp. ZJ77 TaxID=2708337 RepID=UPI00141E7391|nr:SDR family oxidoreductase [Salinibacterium sp. ZJ77]
MTESRITLITGGSRGLGRAAALALADAGSDVVLTYRAEAEAARAVVAEIEASGRRAVALQLDTTASGTFPAFAEALVAALRDTWGRESFDALVNNAGFAGFTEFGSIESEQIDALVAVHLTGVVLLTQTLAPLLADGGGILNVSSGLTRNPANPALSVYAAVKGAAEVWTLYLAKQLGPRRITVNVIAPGATATDFAGGALLSNAQYRAMIEATVALGRVGEPDDIGAAVAAVLDPRMGWVTGQRIEVSGGQRL